MAGITRVGTTRPYSEQQRTDMVHRRNPPAPLPRANRQAKRLRWEDETMKPAAAL
jgi:hypothetical protein